MRSRSPYIGMVGGLLVAAGTILAWRAIAGSEAARPLYSVLCCPEYPVFALLSDWFSVHSDTGVRVLLAVIHVVYCVTIGGLVGLGFAAFAQRRKTSA